MSNAPLSKQLSNRVPAEIWQTIAAHTIRQYHILLVDDTGRRASSEPLSEVNINNNQIQEIVNISLVSKVFDKGVRSGFRNNFSGRIYFWFGNFRREICTFIKTKLASQVKRLDIHMWSTDDPTLETFKSTWSNFLHSGGFPNLQEVRVFAPYTVDYDAGYDIFADNQDDYISEDVAKIKSLVATAGLDVTIPSAFRIYAYIWDEDWVGLGLDTMQIGVTGRTIADQWRRKCDVPITYRRLEMLWSVTEKKPAST